MDRIWRGCSARGARAARAYASLARAIRLLVLDGRLPLRTRLPGERELAEALGVSRTTRPPRTPRCATRGSSPAAAAPGSWTRLPADPARRRRRRRRPGDGRDRPQLRRPAPAPEGALHAALAAATAELPRHLPGPGYDAAGLPALRAAIAEHFTRRGVADHAGPGLRDRRRAARVHAAAARARPAPGDRVLVEHPTYAAALDADPRRRRAARAGADARRRLGSRHVRGDAAPGRAAARVPDPRPPEPDRSDAAGGRPRAARRPRPRDAHAARRSTRRSSGCTSTRTPRRRRRSPRSTPPATP